MAEINRVTYDADLIDVHQIEQWLVESGTYLRTIESGKEMKPAGSR